MLSIMSKRALTFTLRRMVAIAIVPFLLWSNVTSAAISYGCTPPGAQEGQSISASDCADARSTSGESVPCAACCGLHCHCVHGRVPRPSEATLPNSDARFSFRSHSASFPLEIYLSPPVPPPDFV